MTQAQTVMDADDMVLKHRRVITRGELPRKLIKGKHIILSRHDLRIMNDKCCYNVFNCSML